MSFSKSNICGTGEPSSYQHMEQALSTVAGNHATDSIDVNSDVSASGCGSTPGIDESAPVATVEFLSEKPQKLLGPGTTSTQIPSLDVVDDLKPSPPSQGTSTPAFASVGSPLASTVDDGFPGVIASPLDLGSSGESSVVAAVAAAAASVASAAADISSSTLPLAIHAAQSSERTVRAKGVSLRRGKWTAEEEAYVARVIQDFNSGFLNAPAGTTLRSYLSDKLQCDPMRITKKFTGESCIGKRVFHPAVRSAANANAIDKAQSDLDALEKKWRRRLEMQQRESAKKAAASAAASRESTAMVQGVPVAVLGSGVQSANHNHIQQTAVTQAASWLDRANAILKGTIASEKVRDYSNHTSTSSSPQPRDESTQSSGEDSLENQLKEVQRLIYEGPVIQQTAAAFPNLLIQQSQDLGNSTSGSVAIPYSTVSASAPGPISPDLEPADKRLRTSGASVTSGAEDAEALMGFLSSVHASAAAGHDL